MPKAAGPATWLSRSCGTCWNQQNRPTELCWARRRCVVGTPCPCGERRDEGAKPTPREPNPQRSLQLPALPGASGREVGYGPGSPNPQGMVWCHPWSLSWGNPARRRGRHMQTFAWGRRDPRRGHPEFGAALLGQPQLLAAKNQRWRCCPLAMPRTRVPRAHGYRGNRPVPGSGA